MNILQDIRELKTGPRELRNFGLLVGGVFATLGLLAWVRSKGYFPYLLAPGLLLMVLGAVLPRLLKPIYIGWMTLAFILGFIVSHLILGMLFYGVFTPLGLLARLAGKDFLSLKRDPSAKSYWKPRDRRSSASPEEYERQY